MTEKKRKTDRRTLYTIGTVKDAFLLLMREMPYEKISVKAICEKAEISRATFYIHFGSVNEVLDAVLDDALLFSEEAAGNAVDLIDIVRSGRAGLMLENEAVLPACQRIADSERYRSLFMDASLGDYIIGRLFRHEKDRVVPELMKKTGLPQEYAEMLFRFMLHGSFHVNKSLGWQKNGTWFRFQHLLSVFLDGGMKEIGKSGEMQLEIKKESF